MKQREWLTRELKREAHRLGFDAVGISQAGRLEPTGLLGWLGEGFHGQMAYMERTAEKRLDPSRVVPSAKSIISVALGYLHSYALPYSEATRGVISRYASAEDYHEVMQSRLRELEAFLKTLVPGAHVRAYVDTGPVMEKVWAQKGGIGWIGKHTNLIARRKIGSWFFLGEILSDVELLYDRPEVDHCGSCRVCIDACPTSAIVEPYQLDSRKCISYLTIELKEDIPEKLRQAMANLVFGCDICQDVCPWNRKAPASGSAEFTPRSGLRSPELRRLSAITKEDFRRLFRDSPILRPKWRGFMRNVAVAMGNSGDPDMLPDLKRLLHCDEPLVRRHAAWALAQIGGTEARDFIRQRTGLEKDALTYQAFQELLARPTS